MGKVPKVAGPTRFGADAAHSETAEGLAVHQGAGALSVYIKVSYAKISFRLCKVSGASGKDGSGKRKGCIVRDVQRLIE